MRLALPPIMLHNLSPRAFLYDAVLYWEINLIWFIWFDDTYRSIANGCWLITSARVYCQCGPLVAPYTDIYTKKWRQISSASLPERHVRVPKQSYIDFSDNFNFGELVCRRVWLSASWSVGELDLGLPTLDLGIPGLPPFPFPHPLPTFLPFSRGPHPLN